MQFLIVYLVHVKRQSDWQRTRIVGGLVLSNRQVAVDVELEYVDLLAYRRNEQIEALSVDRLLGGLFLFEWKRKRIENFYDWQTGWLRILPPETGPRSLSSICGRDTFGESDRRSVPGRSNH